MGQPQRARKIRISNEKYPLYQISKLFQWLCEKGHKTPVFT